MVYQTKQIISLNKNSSSFLNQNSTSFLFWRKILHPFDGGSKSRSFFLDILRGLIFAFNSKALRKMSDHRISMMFYLGYLFQGAQGNVGPPDLYAVWYLLFITGRSGKCRTTGSPWCFIFEIYSGARRGILDRQTSTLFYLCYLLQDVGLFWPAWTLRSLIFAIYYRA